MGLMCAALSITSCSKDNTETFDKPKGYEFELYAAPQTRTEVDGLDMKWSADDAMNVFHAPTGTTNYSSNDQFTLAEIESGRFTGLITDTEFDPNGTYDWYVLYPYKSQKTTPALDEAYFGIGSYATSVQTQKGINNQDHICGVDIPLYGKVTNTTGSPRLVMHHIATLFRINVTNTGSADLNVTNITLSSASENLIGTYYFDITGAAPVLTPSGDKYVSKTAALNVTDGIVAPDATGSFYLATRAFTAPEGEQLTLTVTANGETVEKVATLSKETTFAAGKINKLNIDIEGKEVVGLSLPFTDDFSWASEDANSNTELKLVDYPEGKYSDTKKTYKGKGGLKVGSSNDRGYFTTAGLDLSEPFSVIVNAAQYGSDNSTLNITIGETTQSADLNATAQDYVFNFEPQGNNTTVTVKIEGKRGYIYHLDIIKGHDVTLPPVLEITSPATISIGQEGDIATITYNVQNPVEGGSVTAEADVDWINSFDYTTSGEVSFIVDTNNDASRTGVVTLSYEGAESKTVTIQQAGVSSGEAEWHAESWSTLNQSANTYGAGSISGDLGTWEYTGCSGYDMEQFNTKKSLALGKTSDNSSITSPTFANGISGIKFNYFANNTARTILVTIYENGVSVKQETITPTSKNQLGTATIDITTSGPTYFTFTPGSSDRRVSIGDIEVNY